MFHRQKLLIGGDKKVINCLFYTVLPRISAGGDCFSITCLHLDKNSKGYRPYSDCYIVMSRCIEFLLIRVLLHDQIKPNTLKI